MECMFDGEITSHFQVLVCWKAYMSYTFQSKYCPYGHQKCKATHIRCSCHLCGLPFLI